MLFPLITAGLLVIRMHLSHDLFRGFVVASLFDLLRFTDFVALFHHFLGPLIIRMHLSHDLLIRGLLRRGFDFGGGSVSCSWWSLWIAPAR